MSYVIDRSLEELTILKCPWFCAALSLRHTALCAVSTIRHASGDSVICALEI
jgi:hypothetical protein